MRSCGGSIGTLLPCSCGRFQLEGLLLELTNFPLRLPQLRLGVCCPLPFGKHGVQLRLSGALRQLLRC